jgi:hypothetical protein
VCVCVCVRDGPASLELDIQDLVPLMTHCLEPASQSALRGGGGVGLMAGMNPGGYCCDRTA